MLFKTAVILSLAALPFVAAQATEAEIENIEAHFTQSRITDYLADFEPSALLTLTYEGAGELTPGQELSAAEAGPQPIVTVTPEGDDVLNGTYTIAMIDVDFVGADLSAGVTRHWLVNGVTVGEDGVVNVAAGNAITPYGGPGPADGSGAHRYVVVLYEQPADFAAPEPFAAPVPIAAMDWNGYVEASNLGDLVAANYIQVEEGTFTGTAVATSAVVAATGGAGASGSAGSSPSGAAGSGSGTGSGSGAPRPTGAPASGAGKLTAFSLPVVLFGAAAVLAL